MSKGVWGKNAVTVYHCICVITLKKIYSYLRRLNARNRAYMPYKGSPMTIAKATTKLRRYAASIPSKERISLVLIVLKMFRFPFIFHNYSVNFPSLWVYHWNSSNFYFYIFTRRTVAGGYHHG